jgi:hypothetical protein
VHKLGKEKKEEEAQVRLRRLAEECRDERLHAIADEMATTPGWLESSLQRPPSEAWRKDLKGDRERQPRARSRQLVRLQSIAWYEERRRWAVGLAEQHRVGTERVEQLTASEQPFVELLSDAARQKCVAALGGEAQVRSALAKYYGIYRVDRRYFSIALAYLERQERQVRGGREELWEILQTVRDLAGRVRALSAPADVVASIDFWHWRVLEYVKRVSPMLPQAIAELKRVATALKVPLREDPPTRFRRLRQREERRMRGLFSAQEIAILETAWLVPVVETEDGGLQTVSGPSDSALPTRPRFGAATAQGAGAYAGRFYRDRVRALKSLGRAR